MTISTTAAPREPFASIRARIGAACAGSGRQSAKPGELDALGQKFAGLPPGVAHAKNLLEPLRELGTRLPFPRAALSTLDILVDLSPAGPWLKGDDATHPIAVVSNYELASRLGRDIRTVRFHIRWLAEAGVIARRPGPSGHRTRRAMPDGTEIRYGIDLAPLVAFSQRMRAEVREARAHRAKMKMLKGEIRSVAIEAAQLRDGASGLAGIALEREAQGHPVPEAVREAALAAVESGRRIEELAEAAARLLESDATTLAAEQPANAARMAELASLAGDALAAMRHAVMTGIASLPPEAWIGADGDTTDAGAVARSRQPEGHLDSSMGESGFPQTHTSGLTPPAGGYRGARIVVRQAGDVRPVDDQLEMAIGQEPVPDGKGQPPRKRIPDVELAVERLIELDPELPRLLHVATGVADLADVRPQHILDVARYIAIEEFGATPRMWGEQCGRIGPVVAALAALLTYAKPAENIRNGSRLSYWLGICRKPNPEINLVPSIFAAHRRRREAEKVPA